MNNKNMIWVSIQKRKPKASPTCGYCMLYDVYF